MKRTLKIAIPLIGFFLLTGFLKTLHQDTAMNQSSGIHYPEGSFGYDLKVLSGNHEIVILKSTSGQGLVAVSPKWQGRVMTSSLAGYEGKSLGWINHKLITSDHTEKHINAYGGEDRFWFGPEGGQYSVYFKPGVPFTFENWFVPPCIDTEPFEIISLSDTCAEFERSVELINYSGNQLKVKVTRRVRLLGISETKDLPGIPDESVHMVGYQSENTLTNTGRESWKEETGLLSVWILGMFRPSPATTVVIPFKPGDESLLGPRVNDSYFGKIPSDRLKVKDSVLYFRTDGKQRGKLGISPKRVMPWMGAFDSESGVLTLVSYNLPERPAKYVNSRWEIQQDPYRGDVVNSYNDGPLEDGTQMGPFFELESSSPAKELKPGESLMHVHKTIHLSGNREKLNAISEKLLGTSLNEIESAF